MNHKRIESKVYEIISKPENLDHQYTINRKTYREVYNLASEIYSKLNETCSKDDYICIVTEKKEIITASIISSLAGGPGLILPYSYSQQVIDEVSRNEKISYIITDNTVDMEFPKNIRTLCISDETEYKHGPIEFNTIRNLDDIFIKLFTGGSTGTPKVWTKTVKNIFSEALFLSEKFSITEKDKFLGTVPPYHIYGFLFTVILPFICGASVFEDTSTFPREIISNIEEYSITILASVPMHYRVLKNMELPNNNLRLAFSSAGALDQEDGSAFHKNSGIGVTEIYGSTETGGIATRNRSLGEASLVPFDCIQWKIDEDLLCIKSDFISKELQLDSEGFFTTSDRIEKIEENSFLLLGRADGIIKVAGRRVDLGEIQNKIKSIDKVRDAVVLSLPTNSGRENEIVAMIESELSEFNIKQLLSTEIEPYAMPRRIKIEKKLPVLSTGKYDRNRIREFF